MNENDYQQWQIDFLYECFRISKDSWSNKKIDLFLF